MVYIDRIDPVKVEEEYKRLSKRDDLTRETLLKLTAASNVENLMVRDALERLSRERTLIQQGFPIQGSVPVGLKAFGVPAGATTLVCSRPQVPFRGNRLAVDPACAPYFDILDVRVGKNSHNITSDPIAATMFPPLPAGLEEKDLELFERMGTWVKLKLELCQVMQVLSVTVLNKDLEGKAHDFDAAIWGFYLEP